MHCMSTTNSGHHLVSSGDLGSDVANRIRLVTLGRCVRNIVDKLWEFYSDLQSSSRGLFSSTKGGEGERKREGEGESQVSESGVFFLGGGCAPFLCAFASFPWLSFPISFSSTVPNCRTMSF